MIADFVSYELIAIVMFATMLLMLLTGQRVFGAIGFVSAAAAILVFDVASDCRAASDAAVTSARHVCCDCVSF